MGDSSGEIGGVINTGDAFAAGAVHRLDDDGPVKVVDILQSIVALAVATCIGHVEAVVGKELAEPGFVLQDTGGLVAALERQAHLLGRIGCCHDAGIDSKRHDAVNLQLLGQREHGVLVDDAHVVVLIAVPVGDIVRQVIYRNDVDAMTMRSLDDRQQVAQTAQEHQFLLSFDHRCHLLMMISRMRVRSSSVSWWCMGRQMTVSAMRVALGRFSRAALGSPR